MSEQSSYRQIVKTTSIFGGVQVFSIIISVIRAKFIAILLGPAGVGINSLLNSTTEFIAGLSNFGLGTSAVKNVAVANESGDTERVSTVATVLKRLVWVTGLLGAVITIVLSPWLSQLTFGNRDYTLAFIWISITLLLNQISNGNTVILRGMRQINYLARSTLSGSIIGLVIAIPIYYIWGIDGIVPAIIGVSIANLFRTWYFTRKVKIEKATISLQDTIKEGKDMLTMGFMLSISGLYVLAKSIGIKAFISHIGGLEEVGLYSAGFAIVNTYVGMVFTAMSTDYYPKLSAVAKDNHAAKKLINQQGEIAILILAPIITVFIIFIGWIIILLYSNKFIPINQMIQWAALGMFFKAASWCVAFLFLAKGRSKLFLANELIGGTVTLICHLLGYYLGGLTGMGIGFMVGYLYYMIQVFFVARRYFEFNFEKEFVKIMIVQLALAILSFVIAMLLPKPISYIMGSIVIILSTVYSYIELDKRIDIKQVVRALIKKRNDRLNDSGNEK